MDGPLGFGMVRQQTATMSPALLTELCDRMNRELGLATVPYLASSYADLSQAMERGELALAWMAPIPVLDLEARGLVRPLALPVRRGNTSFHAALVVRRHGPRSIEELSGYRVGWVDKESAAGYLVPRLHLASAGVDLARFFSDEVFLGTHFAVVDAVVTGRVDVGATFCTMDPTSGRTLTAGWTDAEGTVIRPVDVLATMGPVPNDCIVASSSLPFDVGSELVAWLLQPEGRLRELVLELFHAQSFRAGTATHYEPLRQLREAARSRGDADPKARRDRPTL